MDADSLAALLADRSQGNFMYAALVTQDLLAGRSEPGTFEDLLPRSLSSYYARHWRTMRGSDPERFRLVYEPVLHVLATARPESGSTCSSRQPSLVPAEGDSRMVTVLWRWFAERVTKVSTDSYHPSFREFAADALGLVLPGRADGGAEARRSW